MTRKKKIISGVVILSLALAAVVGAAIFRGPNGAWGKPFHAGFHRGFHHGPHAEDVADFMVWKMDKHANELDLNEAQRQEYEKVKAEVKRSIAEAMTHRMEFHSILRDEMSRQNPDLNALATIAKERVNRIPENLTKHIDLFLNLYNLLNEEQKGKLIDMFRSRMDLKD